MSRKKLVDAFEIKLKETRTPIVSDYEIFKDKSLLDNLRNRIIQNLIDNKMPNGKKVRTVY